MTCFIGRGSLYLKSLEAPEKGFHLLTSTSEISIKTVGTSLNIKDSRAGITQDVDVVMSALAVTCDLKVSQFAVETYERLFNSARQEVAAVVEVFSLPIGITNGMTDYLRTFKNTSFSLADSLSAPLTLNTHYTYDARTNLVTFVDVATFTQPFTCTVNRAATVENVLLNRAPALASLYFSGFNRVTNAQMVVELYKVFIDLPDALPLVSKSFSESTVIVTVLADTTRPRNATLSNYGVITT